VWWPKAWTIKQVFRHSLKEVRTCGWAYILVCAYYFAWDTKRWQRCSPGCVCSPTSCTALTSLTKPFPCALPIEASLWWWIQFTSRSLCPVDTFCLYTSEIDKNVIEVTFVSLYRCLTRSIPPFHITYWRVGGCGSSTQPYTDMRSLTTGVRSEKCVVRRFRRCANVYLHKLR
jgi:hypothetical protein